MSKPSDLVAACGLDFKECDILRATYSPELAHRIADWFKEHEAPQIRPQDIHCLGCKGGQSTALVGKLLDT
jgi:hypothetical protein